MADSTIAATPGVGLLLDSEKLAVGANPEVHRQRIEIAGAAATDIVSPVAHDAVDAGNSLKIGGKASRAVPTEVSAAGDRVDAFYSLNGQQGIIATVEHGFMYWSNAATTGGGRVQVLSATGSLTTTGTIIPAFASRRARILSLVACSSAVVILILKDGAGGTAIGQIQLPVNGSWTLPPAPGLDWGGNAVGNTVIELAISAAATVYYTVVYVLVA